MFKTQIASFETEMKPTEPREAAMHRPATETTAALRPMVYASLFAALTAVGAYISVPIGPVPIVMQNMFVFLAGLLLGSRWGLASLAVYLLAGACGLPVFAGGTGGIARFAGPTGGFLVGYLPVVFWVGWIAERRPESMLRDVAAMVCGFGEQASLETLAQLLPFRSPILRAHLLPLLAYGAALIRTHAP